MPTQKKPCYCRTRPAYPESRGRRPLTVRDCPLGGLTTGLTRVTDFLNSAFLETFFVLFRFHRRKELHDGSYGASLINISQLGGTQIADLKNGSLLVSDNSLGCSLDADFFDSCSTGSSSHRCDAGWEMIPIRPSTRLRPMFEAFSSAWILVLG